MPTPLCGWAGSPETEPQERSDAQHLAQAMNNLGDDMNIAVKEIDRILKRAIVVTVSLVFAPLLALEIFNIVWLLMH